MERAKGAGFAPCTGAMRTQRAASGSADARLRSPLGLPVGHGDRKEIQSQMQADARRCDCGTLPLNGLTTDAVVRFQLPVTFSRESTTTFSHAMSRTDF